ncbi:MAG: cell division protein FtsA [Patescibacteria group bacterium]
MYTALDLGSSSIKAVVADEKNGKLSILGIIKQPSAGFRKGVLVEPEEAVNVLRKVFADLRLISKKAVQNIFVNVNGANVKIQPSRGVAAVSKADSEIRQDDVDRALQASQAVKLAVNYVVLHNITREFFVDEIGDIADPLGMNGSRLEVSSLIVGAFAPFVNNIVRYVEKAGGSVGGLIFNPIAASRSALSKNQKELGSLLIDIGFSTTSFAVYDENKILYAASLPIGSSHITNDIAIGLKISVEAAEKIKLNYGFALSKEIPRRDALNLRDIDSSLEADISRRFLAEIVEVRLAEILELINNELKSLNRHGRLPAGTVLTGGGARLPGTADLVKQYLRLPCQIGIPDISLFEIKNAGYEELLTEPEFAAAVGLLLSAVEKKTKNFETDSPFKKFFKNFIP